MSTFLSQFLCTLITVVLKPIYGQTCAEHTQTLPVALRGHEVIYSSQTKNAYIFGGDPARNKTYKWDLHGAFQTIGSIPQSASRFYTWSSNAVLIDNIIWFIGMRYKDSYESDLIFKYNVMTEQWEDTSNLLAPPVSLSYGCLATNLTHTFLVDGKSDNLDRNPRVLQIYNIADNQWTTHATPYDDKNGYAWEYQYCYVVNNELFVFGGRFEYKKDPIYYVGEIHKYNLHSNQWVTLSVPFHGSAYGGKTVFYNDVLYIVGDYSTNIIRAFNINTQTFDENMYMTLPISVEQVGVILVDNIIYVLGGRLADDPSPLSVIQYCTLPTKEPTAAPSVNPSVFPSISPSAKSSNPSAFPSRLPSVNPSTFPSVSPSTNPSTFPSLLSSGNPSTFPSLLPSINPSESPFTSMPTVYKNGEAEVVEWLISSTQLEDSNDIQNERIVQSNNIYVGVLVTISVLFIVGVVTYMYLIRRNKAGMVDMVYLIRRNKAGMNALDNAVVQDGANNTNKDADVHHQVILDKGRNMSHSDDEDDEEIITGINTLGGDTLCNNRDLERVEDDQDIIAGVTLGADSLCDHHDLEGDEEVIVEGNTLGEVVPSVPLTNNSNVTDFVANQDETIVGDDELNIAGTAQ